MFVRNIIVLAVWVPMFSGLPKKFWGFHAVLVISPSSEEAQHSTGTEWFRWVLDWWLCSWTNNHTQSLYSSLIWAGIALEFLGVTPTKKLSKICFFSSLEKSFSFPDQMTINCASEKIWVWEMFLFLNDRSEKNYHFCSDKLANSKHEVKTLKVF